jgi:dihydrofolate synthase/folylpolyglutamate synthase
MLAAVLQSAGYKTGLYTSPHLADFRERIRVNGEVVQEDFVVRFIGKYMQAIDKVKPSFFEMTVAMAFSWFADQQVDIAVIEVGMGGRLDSTNIIAPVVSVITNIGYDHMQFLGQTLVEIAREKAEIIKPGIPVVIGEFQEDVEEVFRSKAANVNAPVYYADREYFIGYSLKTIDQRQSVNIYREDEIAWEGLETDQLGFYQRQNVVTAIKTLEILGENGIEVSREAVFSGFGNIAELTGLRGRWEVLGHRPLTVCDTAHNPEGLSHVVEQIRQTPWKNLHFVIGLVEDKEPGDLLALLPDNASYYVTQANIPRAMDRFGLLEKMSTFSLRGDVYDNPVSALNAAKEAAGEDDMIFIGGSTFIVAEVL